MPTTVRRENKLYTISEEGEVKEAIKADRTGINVGDYITYTSPTESITFNEAETGYSEYEANPVTLSRKTLFRVMDIDYYGNITLLGIVEASDSKIYFSGAKGYNNAVYTLNKKCSDLYDNISNGIKARSIKVEDITSKFSETGNNKITTYINDNMPTSTGTYLTNIDTVNKKLTYQTRTNCPDIFQYEQDGEIDEISTSGLVGQSDYYRGYNGLTNLSNKTPKATTLTVPFTSYVTSHESSDFSNESMSLIYQSMFFETNTDYWLASRCIGCYSNYVYYRLRFVSNNSLNVQALYISEGTIRSNRSHLCPVVYIPSSVRINVSNDANTLSGTPHLIITE